MNPNDEVCVIVDVRYYAINADMILANKYIDMDDMMLYVLTFFLDEDEGCQHPVARRYDLAESMADQLSGHPDFMPIVTHPDYGGDPHKDALYHYERVMGCGGNLAAACEEYYLMIRDVVLNTIPLYLREGYQLDRVKYLGGNIISTWLRIQGPVGL